MVWYRFNKSPSILQMLLKQHRNYDKDHHQVKREGFTNLTSMSIPNSHKYLGLGVRFIPPPQPTSNSEIIQGLSILERTIKLNHHFRDKTLEDENFNPKLKTPKSSWLPPEDNTTRELKTTLLEFKSDLNNLLKEPYYDPKRDSKMVKGLKTLLKSIDLKFTNSDKNLGIVALTKDHYNTLVMDHLSNTEVYSHINTHVEQIHDAVAAIVADRLKRLPDLSKQERTYLLSRDSATFPNFHVLPKLHKTPIKGRPIVGATNWWTTNSSIILDQRLIPYLQQEPQILQNSRQLLPELTPIKPSATKQWLVTLDVTTLYTNIDLTRLRQVIQQTTYPNHESPTQLLDFVTNHNYFMYNNNLYKQDNGIAMGTNSAVNLANLYMAKTFDHWVLSLPKTTLSLYKRYIDDLFLILNCTEEYLKEFLALANRQVQGLTFTMNYDANTIDFLDLTIYKGQDRFLTKTFNKSISKFLYLPKSSCHHPAVFRGFIKGEFIRHARLCNNEADYEEQASQFCLHLKERAYKQPYIDRIKTLINWREVHNAPPRIKSKSPPNPKWANLPIRYSNRDLSNLHAFIKTHENSFLDYNSRIRIVWRTSPSINKLLLPTKTSPSNKQYSPPSTPQQGPDDRRKSNNPTNNRITNELIPIDNTLDDRDFSNPERPINSGTYHYHDSTNTFRAPIDARYNTPTTSLTRITKRRLDNITVSPPRHHPASRVLDYHTPLTRILNNPHDSNPINQTPTSRPFNLGHDPPRLLTRSSVILNTPVPLTRTQPTTTHDPTIPTPQPPITGTYQGVYRTLKTRRYTSSLQIDTPITTIPTRLPITPNQRPPPTRVNQHNQQGQSPKRTQQPTLNTTLITNNNHSLRDLNQVTPTRPSLTNLNHPNPMSRSRESLPHNPNPTPNRVRSSTNDTRLITDPNLTPNLTGPNQPNLTRPNPANFPRPRPTSTSQSTPTPLTRAPTRRKRRTPAPVPRVATIIVPQEELFRNVEREWNIINNPHLHGRGQPPPPT